MQKSWTTAIYIPVPCADIDLSGLYVECLLDCIFCITNNTTHARGAYNHSISKACRVNHMTVMTFRIEDDVKNRLDIVVQKLGLNQSKILRDAVIERLIELEEMAEVMDRLKANRQKRPINELWKELGLEN